MTEPIPETLSGLILGGGYRRPLSGCTSPRLLAAEANTTGKEYAHTRKAAWWPSHILDGPTGHRRVHLLSCGRRGLLLLGHFSQQQ